MSVKKTLNLPPLYFCIKYLSNTFAVLTMGGDFITLLCYWTFLNLLHLLVHPDLHNLSWNHF